mgnify:CR=1 FL=1
MVLQYKLKKSPFLKRKPSGKEERWKNYKGKARLKFSVSKYDFRLLSKDKKKILVNKGTYKKVMKRFRQIEFFKHR